MHVGQTRTRAHSHSLSGGSPVLKERHTSFTCKSTQTDCDVPGSAVNGAMFKYRGSSNDIPYEIRMDDIELNETMVVAFSPLTSEAVIKNCYSKASSST